MVRAGVGKSKKWSGRISRVGNFSTSKSWSIGNRMCSNSFSSNCAATSMISGEEEAEVESKEKVDADDEDNKSSLEKYNDEQETKSSLEKWKKGDIKSSLGKGDIKSSLEKGETKSSLET